MVPKRTDVHILCTKCNKAIESQNRLMIHDPGSDVFRYEISCHGQLEAHEIRAKNAHGTRILAFSSPAAESWRPLKAPS